MTDRTFALRTLLTLFLLLPVSGAFAGDLSMVINGKSYHVGSRKDWNENNYGLGFEYQLDTQTRWKPVTMANAFRDSRQNMSYMAGGGLHRNLLSSRRFDGLYVDVGLNVFLMTRKFVNDGKPFPGALPSLTVGNRYMGLNVTYLPKFAIERVAPDHGMDEDMRGIAFVQFKLNLSTLNNPDRRPRWRLRTHR